jgi:hypothetical protein
MSQIKDIEGIICPNLRITKVANRTRSITHYLEQYISEYSPLILNDEGKYESKYTLSTEAYNRFNQVECPEMQWNQPTLREVLNDLMMVDDCICVLINNEISFIDVSVSKGEASKDNINYIIKSRSIDDYVSDIRMNIVNGIDSEHSTKVEQLRFRNNNVYILGSNTIQLETSFPIWNIKSLKATVYLETGATVIGTDEVGIETRIRVPAGTALTIDLTPYVLEYDEWKTKDVYYSGFTYTDMALSSDYQNTSLYYVRGGNKILNWDNQQTSQFLFIKNTTSVYELVLYSTAFYDRLIEIAKEQEPGYVTYEYGDYPINPADFKGDGNFNFFDFEIEYDAIDNCTFSATKSPMPNHRRTVIDNQSNSYVNISKQGKLEYSKANRLGNQVSIYNARYSNESDIIDVGYSLDDNIIFKREISIFKHYVDVNYYATKNYVLRDYFTGIRAKKRSWNIVSGEEASIRAELLKFYVNENTSINRGVYINNVLQTYKIPDYTIEEFVNSLNYCAIRFNLGSSKYQPQNIEYEDGNTYNVNAYLVEFTKHVVGNSVLLTIKMLDNTLVGKYIYNYLDSLQVNRPSDYTGNFIGGTLQKNASYTDSNGEFIGGTIFFYDEKNDTSENEIFLRPAINRANNFPNSPILQIPFTIHKDNSEIFQISIQLEVNEEANDLFIGKRI